MLARGNELLDAVQHEMIAIPVGAGGDRRRIRTRVRLAQAEAAQLLASGQGFEPAFLLLVAAIFERDTAGQRILHTDDGGSRAVSGRNLFQCQNQRHVVQAGAAPLFRHHHAKGTESAEFLKGFRGKE